MGRGAYSVVRSGIHTKTNERVAVMLISKSVTTVANWSLFSQREGRILRQLRHPNIIHVRLTTSDTLSINPTRAVFMLVQNTLTKTLVFLLLLTLIPSSVACVQLKFLSIAF